MVNIALKEEKIITLNSNKPAFAISKKSAMDKILIIGGGIAGLTTAAALQQKGISYEIFEAVPEIKALGAGISLAGNAVSVLKHLQLEEAAREGGHVISQIILQDQRGKKISITDTRKLLEPLGLFNVGIHRGTLHRILLSKVTHQNIHTNKKAIAFQEKPDRIIIQFSDGSEYEGAGAIVADGIHSIIRQQIYPQSVPRYAGYTCWRGVGPNRLNVNGLAAETWGRAGRFGYVPLGNNEIYWFACVNARRNSNTMKGYTIHDIATRFSGYAHPISAIIRDTPEENLLWNDIIDIKPLPRLAFGRLVLIGDAGHATTPNLGQGACQAMEDALEVSTQLASTDSVKQAFANFEQNRLKRVHYIVNESHKIGKIAQLENPFLIALRNMAFRLTPQRMQEQQVKRVLNI